MFSRERCLSWPSRGSPGDALLFVRQLVPEGMGLSWSTSLEGAALVLDSAAELSCCKTSALLSFQSKHQVLCLFLPVAFDPRCSVAFRRRSQGGAGWQAAGRHRAAFLPSDNGKGKNALLTGVLSLSSWESGSFREALCASFSVQGGCRGRAEFSLPCNNRS